MNKFMRRHNLPMIQIVREYNDIWELPLIYSYVYTRKICGRWVAIYR